MSRQRTGSCPDIRLVPLAAAFALAFAGPALAATIAVNTGNLTHGSGNCTLLDAVNSINQGNLVAGTGCSVNGAFGDNDTVLLGNHAFAFSNASAGGGLPTDAASAMVLSKPMTLIGSTDNDGRPLATIHRDPAASNFRLIDTNADLTLIGVAIRNGRSDPRGDAVGRAGGILAYNPDESITLTLVNSVMSGNTAIATANKYGSAGGGILTNGTLVVRDSTLGSTNYYLPGNSAGVGGAVASSGDVFVYGSTINGNQAGVASGGGIFTTGDVTLVNSTIYGNQAHTEGGGIAAHAIHMTFCTVTGNSAGAGHLGGGMFINADSTATASLLANNGAGKDIDTGSPGLVLTGNYNSIQATGTNLTVAGSFNKLDSAACDAPGVLAYNGGPTQTMALSSPADDCAIDAGPGSVAGIGSDQRGRLFVRRSGAATDIGAFELQPLNDRIFYDGFEP